MSWQSVALGAISDSIDYGVTASATDEDTGTKFLRITDIQDNSVDWRTVPFCISDARKLAAAALAPGDIVFARTGATTGKSFRIRNCPDNAVFASYLIRVRPSRRIDSDFLSHFFQTNDYWNQIQSFARGATQPGVNSTVLRELRVPLPPLNEQRRIAAILDQADTLRRKRRLAMERLGELRRSLFDEMFGSHDTNPKNWPLGRISDVAASTQYGTSGKAGEVGEFPILRMGNITFEGGWKLDDLKFIDLPAKDVAKYTVRPGDVLFNRTNSPDLVGKTAVFRESEKFAFAGYLVRLRVNDHAHPEFVSAYLNSKHGKNTLRGMCKSIIGMANINAKELTSIPLMLPPFELQRKFGELVEQTLSAEKLHTVHFDQLDALFVSLQHRAFRGEL